MKSIARSKRPTMQWGKHSTWRIDTNTMEFCGITSCGMRRVEHAFNYPGASSQSDGRNERDRRCVDVALARGS
jgi:hypothetical protein